MSILPLWIPLSKISRNSRSTTERDCWSLSSNLSWKSLSNISFTRAGLKTSFAGVSTAHIAPLWDSEYLLRTDNGLIVASLSTQYCWSSFRFFYQHLHLEGTCKLVRRCPIQGQSLCRRDRHPIQVSLHVA